jgi:hypothetical protein
MLDEHGYPTDEALLKIEKWPFEDLSGLMEFIKELWWEVEWGWQEKEKTKFLGHTVTLYKISTGGWSGNEDLIEAMGRNDMFWMMCWASSRRGGHFEFEVRNKGNQ